MGWKRIGPSLQSLPELRTPTNDRPQQQERHLRMVLVGQQRLDRRSGQMKACTFNPDDTASNTGLQQHSAVRHLAASQFACARAILRQSVKQHLISHRHRYIATKGMNPGSVLEDPQGIFKPSVRADIFATARTRQLVEIHRRDRISSLYTSSISDTKQT